MWCKETGRQFIIDYFPEYLTIYDNYKNVVSRCDMLRICLMYKFGGIYCDLDNYPLENIEKYLDKPNKNTYFPELKIIIGVIRLNNNIIISKSESDLFLEMLKYIEVNKNKYHFNKYSEIETYTALPIVEKFHIEKKYDIAVLSYQQFNPYSIGEKQTTVDKSKIVLMQTKGQSWYDDDMKAAAFFLGNWQLFLIVIILFIILLIIII